MSAFVDINYLVVMRLQKCLKSFNYFFLIFWKDAERWTGIITIISLFTGGLVGLWQYKKSNQNQKKEITIQYLTGFSKMLENTDPILLDTINFYNNKVSDTLVYNEFGEMQIEILEKLLFNHKHWRLQLDNIMVYLNQLALGCKDGFYDEYTAWYSNYYRIINAVNALYPYVKIRAKEEKYTKNEKPCGFLFAMQARWVENLGKCKKWNNDDKIESRKMYSKIQKWKNK